jgi:hypothetical protein
MIIHNDAGQSSEAWHALRAPLITASDSSKIFTGGGKVSSQREAYLRTCAVSRKYVLPRWGGNAYTERGKELEPIARDFFIERSKLDVREVMFMEHDNHLCGLSPDGVIFNGSDMVSGLEIKCLGYDKHVGIVTKGELPNDNKSQVHFSLWLSRFKSWQYLPYNPDAMPLDHRVIEVTPDQYTDDMGNEIMKACEELDRRAEEFISDFEKTLTGESILAAMPVLQKSLEIESII